MKKSKEAEVEVMSAREIGGEVREMRTRSWESILSFVAFPDSEMGFEQKKGIIYFLF